MLPDKVGQGLKKGRGVECVLTDKVGQGLKKGRGVECVLPDKVGQGLHYNTPPLFQNVWLTDQVGQGLPREVGLGKFVVQYCLNQNTASDANRRGGHTTCEGARGESEGACARLIQCMVYTANIQTAYQDDQSLHRLHGISR